MHDALFSLARFMSCVLMCALLEGRTSPPRGAFNAAARASGSRADGGFHLADVRRYVLGGGLAVLFQQADDSRADYHAVGERGHGVRLFGRGYAEAARLPVSHSA